MRVFDATWTLRAWGRWTSGVLAFALILAPFRVAAQTAGESKTTITGLVVDSRTALPIPDASVVLGQGDATIATGSTDATGRYVLANISPGVYTITIAARGYAPSASDGLEITAGTAQTLNAALTAASSTSRALPVIGAVSASSNALGAATTITQSIDLQDVTATGQIRLVDQLSTLPAINYSTSSSVGDDTNIDLRGLGVGETAVLLDGHPVGPLGAGLTGSNGAFDWSLGPAFGLSKVQVTYGSGAQGLFGSDTIGGAVDFMTLNPTQTVQGSFQQQIGGFGTLSTGLTASGTLGKLGFAFAAGRLGEYGDFYPGLIAQSARPDNVLPNSVNPNGACAGINSKIPPDVSACNLALNTYTVSQNTMQTMGLAKLAYAVSPVTNIRVTAYNGVQWSDSTGNGDNDYLPYSVRLGQVTSNPTNCTNGAGTPGYIVTTNPIPNPPTEGCYTAQQYAAATSGPSGGGAGRDRGVQLRDYSLLATSQAGPNHVTFSYFVDNYSRWKNSAQAGGEDAEGIYLGSPSYAYFYRTNGFLASDELFLGRNDVSFGYSSWRQYQAAIEADYSTLSNKIAPDDFGENSFFLRDNYAISNRLSAYVNAWTKYSSVTDKTTFDPRVTLQYRPTSSDVLRLTYGRSDGAPSPQLLPLGTPHISDPGASLTTVSCGFGSNGVASSGNPALQSESANDFELGLGHRTGFDSNVQLTAYVTAVQNELFSGLEPLTQFGIGNVKVAPYAFQTYQKVLDQYCGASIGIAQVPEYLGISTEYNAAHALARGIELTGRQHVTRRFYLDYGYDIESSTQSGLSNVLLAANANVLNGAQVMGIPLHTATLSGDYTEGPWEVRLDNYYTEFNNGLNRPSYWHSDAFVSRQVGKETSLTLGGTNIFNSAVQVYGYIGKGTLFEQNPQSISGGIIGPSEEFGLAPAQLTFTLQEKL